MTEPLWKIVWQFLKENIHLPYDPANTLLGAYPREMKTYVQTNKQQQQTNLHTIFIAIVQIKNQWFPGVKDYGRKGDGCDVKEQHEGDLCGDELVLYLACGSGYTNLPVAKWYKQYRHINVNIWS